MKDLKKLCEQHNIDLSVFNVNTRHLIYDTVLSVSVRFDKAISRRCENESDEMSEA